MITHENRIQGLRELGYIEREAEFLCLAALYSGYFIRRQYCQFIGLTSGWPDDNLVHKILSFGHARQIPTNRRTLLYHLCARPFYAAIGEENSRHRRKRPRFSIRSKLMALDFVIAHPGRYLATEVEKIDYFHRQRGISIDLLPSKTYACSGDTRQIRRYFVEKFPISVSQEAVVSFTYIDEGEIATPAFETFLTQHRSLLEALGSFKVVFVGLKERRIREAEKTFRRVLADHNQRRLLRWVELEKLLREERYDVLNLARLDELSELRKVFQNESHRNSIEICKPCGDQAVLDRHAAGQFSACLLPHDYGFLDTARPRIRAKSIDSRREGQPSEPYDSA